MTIARAFDGVDDRIDLAIDASSGDSFGAGTVLALIRTPTASTDTILGCYTSTSTLCWYFYISGSGTLELDCVGGGFSVSTVSVATSTWSWVAVTKAAGSANPRFHRKADGGAWTHADGASAVADPAAPGASGTFRIGYAPGELLQGDIAFVAYWDTVLSDGALESASVDYAALLAASPKADWPLTQASTATAVVDVTTNAHDQVNLVGTTVSGNDAPMPAGGGIDLVVQDAAIAVTADNVVLTETERIRITQSKAEAINTVRTPSLTFATAPLEDDMVIMWPSSTTTATITIPSGWVNVLGGTTDVESDAHETCCIYHRVTAGEAAANTVTFAATNLYDAGELGNTLGCVVRNVDWASPIDAVASTFDSTNGATPHVLAGIAGANVVDGSLVLSQVVKDSTGAYSSAPAAWAFVETFNTNQGAALLRRDGFTTAGVAVDATNITPSAGDEYASITVALTAKPPPIVMVVQDATIAVLADNITLTQVHALVVQDALISVTADNVVLDIVTPGVWDSLGSPGVTLDDTDYGWQSIAVTSDGTVYAQCDDAGLYRSTDHGATWTHWSTDGDLEAGGSWVLRIDPHNETRMWAVSATGNGGPLLSTDSGQTWTLKPAGSPTQLNDCYAIAVDPYLEGHVLATWHSQWSGPVSSGVSESFDNGDTWTNITAGATTWGTGHGVFFLNDSDTWLVGTQGDGIWRTANGGTSWTQVLTENMTHGATDFLRKLGSTYYLVVEHKIYSSTDDCETFTDITGSLSAGNYYSTVATDGTYLYTAPSFPLVPSYGSADTPWKRRAISGGDWSDMTGSPNPGLASRFNGPRYAAFDGDYIFTANYSAGLWRFALELADLVVQDALISVTADNVVLTQVHQLVVQDATISVAADNVALTQVHQLAVQDALIAVTADNVVLAQVHVLTVADALINITADNITVTQVHALVVQDATIAVLADNIALTQVHQLVVADALIAVTADNVVLSQANQLVVQDALISVTADNIVLTQVHQLVVADALISVTADNVVLAQVHNLQVADALISVTADNVTLTGAGTLVVQDALIAVTADNVVLTQVHQLTVADALISVTADNIVLSIPGPPGQFNMQVAIGSPVFASHAPGAVAILLRVVTIAFRTRTAGGATILSQDPGAPVFESQSAGSPSTRTREAGTPTVLARSATLALGHGDPGPPTT